MVFLLGIYVECPNIANADWKIDFEELAKILYFRTFRNTLEILLCFRPTLSLSTTSVRTWTGRLLKFHNQIIQFTTPQMNISRIARSASLPLRGLR